MNYIRDRIARVFENCQSRGAFYHPNIASWEHEWIITWMEREPIELSASEIGLLEGIERAVLGAVR